MMYRLFISCFIFLITLPVFANQGHMPPIASHMDSMHGHRAMMGQMPHWMATFDISYMNMDDTYEGSDKISAQGILNQGYMSAPDKMAMQMAMLHVMYMPSMRFYVMAMLPYMKNNMRMVTTMAARPVVDMQSQGLGDVSFSLGGTPFKTTSQQINLEGGVSLPTGSINQRGNTAMGNDQLLAYSMQLGSGTYDAILKTAYIKKIKNYEWGLGADGMIRTGRNYKHYRLGNNGKLATWLAKKWNDAMKTSIGINYYDWGNIHGAANELNAMMTPVANASLQGGKRADIDVKLQLKPALLRKNGQWLDLRARLPFYQHLNGPQMANVWQVNVAYTVTV